MSNSYDPSLPQIRNPDGLYMKWGKYREPPSQPFDDAPKLILGPVDAERLIAAGWARGEDVIVRPPLPQSG